MRRRARQARRGVALIYALIAVAVLSILILGAGRMVASHRGVAEATRRYAKPIYLAEAAANWQINQMSRVNLPGDHRAVPGRIDYDNIAYDAAHARIGALNANDTGVALDGTSKVWVVSAADNVSRWAPPGNFALYATGTVDGVTRAISLYGQPTFLSEPYVIFGLNKIQFTADAGGNGCSIAHGYIGTNGSVERYVADPPIVPAPNGTFAGCRLGGAGATVADAASGWADAWDVPRLPRPVVWPTIDDILQYIYQGGSTDDLHINSAALANNDNDRIEYMVTPAVARPGNAPKHGAAYQRFAQPVTQLTDAEFSKSNVTINGVPMRVIKITARHRPDDPDTNNPQKNLYCFHDIQMGPNDVLILDIPLTNSGMQPIDTVATSIRILIDGNPEATQIGPGGTNGPAPILPPPGGPSVNGHITITNLAYSQVVDDNKFKVHDQQEPGIIWLNNTGRAIEFSPTLNPANVKVDATTPGSVDFYTVNNFGNYTYAYVLGPGMRGLAYGVNALSAPNNSAGDIIVTGAPNFNVQANALIGNHVYINGKVAVDGRFNGNALEPPSNLNNYVLYYRLSNNYQEVEPTDLTLPRQPLYNYGAP